MSSLNRDRMSTSTHALTITAAALAAFAAMSVADAERAHAKGGVFVGVDANGGFNVGELSADGLGLGANLRVGYDLPVPLLKLAPELQFNYMGFSLDLEDTQNVTDTAATANMRALSGRAGLRVGYSAIVGGALYAHVGYGTAMTRGDDIDVNQAGLSYDVGLAFDVSVPLVTFGLHGGFNSLLPSDAPDADPINWIDVGLHVELKF